MGLFDEFKRLAHPYEDEEPDDDFDGFDDFDAPAPRAERRERPERLERSSRNVDTLYGSSQEEERRSNKVVNIRAAPSSSNARKTVSGAGFRATLGDSPMATGIRSPRYVRHSPLTAPSNLLETTAVWMPCARSRSSSSRIPG